MQHHKSSYSALVTNSNSFLASLIASNLARKSVRVELAHSSQFCFHRLSSQIHCFHLLPHHSNLNEHVDAIIRIVQTCNLDVYLPSCQETTYLASFANTLRMHTRYPFPDGSISEKLRNKANLTTLACNHGLPVPRTQVEDITAATPSSISHAWFPIICKPALSYGSKDCFIAKDQDTLNTILLTMRNKGYSKAVIQEFIPGPLIVWCGIIWQGRLRACFAFEALRTSPPVCGSSVYRRSLIIPRLDELVSRFLTNIAYEGFCTLDFVFDLRDGNFRLIDFNPRFGTSLHAALAAGVDFPWYLLKLARGEDFPWPTYKAGVTSTSLLGHFGRIRKSYAGKLSVYTLLNEFTDVVLHLHMCEEFYARSPLPLLDLGFSAAVQFGSRLIHFSKSSC